MRLNIIVKSFAVFLLILLCPMAFTTGHTVGIYNGGTKVSNTSIKERIACNYSSEAVYDAVSNSGVGEGESSDDDAKKIKIRLPIIMYHSTSDKNLGIYNIKSKQLEEDLKYLIANEYEFITVRDLIDFKSGKTLPKKPVMITVDDGCMNNYYNFFPLLKKYNIKCVMAVIGAKTDENYDSEGRNLAKRSHLTYAQIQEMHDSGLVEIQSHSYDMHYTGKGRRQGMKPLAGESGETYENILMQDLQKWQNKLLEKTGVKCTAVAFPYGIYTERTLKVLDKLGYFAGFTCREGVNILHKDSNFLKLKRINRASGKSAAEFFKKHKI